MSVADAPNRKGSNEELTRGTGGLDVAQSRRSLSTLSALAK